MLMNLKMLIGSYGGSYQHCSFCPSILCGVSVLHFILILILNGSSCCSSCSMGREDYKGYLVWLNCYGRFSGASSLGLASNSNIYILISMLKLLIDLGFPFLKRTYSTMS